MIVLFVCVHNAGRSEMSEAFECRFAKGYIVFGRAQSAGTVGEKALNPLAGKAIEEIDNSMEGQKPTIQTQAMAEAADKIITMGCGMDAEARPARIQ